MYNSEIRRMENAIVIKLKDFRSSSGAALAKQLTWLSNLPRYAFFQMASPAV